MMNSTSTRSSIKLNDLTRFLTGWILVLVGGILLDIDVIAQNTRPLDLRDNLKLARTIDLSNEELSQAKFTERNEVFVSTRNRVTKEWAFYKGDAKHVFSPCSNNKYIGGTINRDGARLAIGCEDFSVEIWNLNTGRRQIRFNVQNPAKSLDYLIPYISPDGRSAVTQFYETAELWDVVTGTKIADLDSSASSCNCNRTVYAVEFSPDQKVAAIAFGGMVFLWNIETGKLLNRLIDKDLDYFANLVLTDGGTVRQLLFSRDGTTIITGSGVGIAKSWNVKTGELLRIFKGHKLGVTSLALSPDEKVLATGSRNQDVKLWDMVTGKQLFSLNNRKEVRRLSFHPDGTRLLSMTSTHAFIWERASGKLLEEMPIADVFTTSFSPDWKFVITPDKKTKNLGLYEYVGK